MAEYALTKRFDLPADRVWAVASDPQKVAQWLPTAQRSTAKGDERVALAGESHGHPYQTSAPLQVDPAARRMSWSAPDGPPYSGWLQVSGDAAGTDVSVHLSMSDERGAAGARADIEEGMAEALDRLAGVARG